MNDETHIFEQYDVCFHYDAHERVWCLSWETDGLGFETDNYSAPNRKAAMEDAVEYLRTHHND